MMRFNGLSNKPGLFLSRKEAFSSGLVWFGISCLIWFAGILVFVLAGGLE